MGGDERDFRSQVASYGAGAARTSRRRLLETIALAAVGLKWSWPAVGQFLPADCDPDEPNAVVPYRDLRRRVPCARPALGSMAEANSTRVRRVVIEALFAYDSATCFALDARLDDWLRALPGNTNLVRVPATYSAVSRLHAQAFYAATRLGKVDQLHTALYEAVEKDGQRLDSVEALATVFASSGVERDAFVTELNSVEAHIGVYRAERRNRRYGVTSVPALVIGGRYLTTPEIAGSNEAMLAAAAERVEALGRRQ